MVRPFGIPSRRDVLSYAMAFGLVGGVPVAVAARTPRAASGDFDFLHGHWRARYRGLADPFSSSSKWIDTIGRLEVRSILGGRGSIDDLILKEPVGAQAVASVRLFDPAGQFWSVRSVDAADAASRALATGFFRGSTGHFHDVNKPRQDVPRARQSYENLSGLQARITKSLSSDGGSSWVTSWVLDLERKAA